jgi:hypothetical protein
MQVDFRGELWFWRGPAPFRFVTVPEVEAEQLAEVSDMVSYGWGMIPARVTIGSTVWSTGLWPKDDGYIVPVKRAVRAAERLELGDDIHLTLYVNIVGSGSSM